MFEFEVIFKSLHDDDAWKPYLFQSTRLVTLASLGMLLFFMTAFAATSTLTRLLLLRILGGPISTTTSLARLALQVALA